MTENKLKLENASSVGRSARLGALPDELKTAIIADIGAVPNIISLLTYTQRKNAICLPLKHDDHLLAIAEEQFVRSNLFYWPSSAPSITPLAGELRHLELDLNIVFRGGDIYRPGYYDIPAADAAKIVATPYFFPKLESLTMNVDNSRMVAPLEMMYSDPAVPASAHGPVICWGHTTLMDTCGRLAGVITRVKKLQFPQWERKGKLTRKVVLTHSSIYRVCGNVQGPTVYKDPEEFDKAIYRMMDWPVTTVVI